jgi:hypothetical protein
MPEKESSRRLPAVLRRLAAHQDLVVTRAQLSHLGIGHLMVASRVAQGVWRELGPRVVVLHSGTLTRTQKLWVGVLHAGPGAVLALSSAAEAGGLKGFEEDEVHVVVEHGREVADLVDAAVTVRVHQTRRVTADVVPLRQPTRQTIARSVLELASGAPADNRTRALIAASVQQGLVRPDHLRAYLAKRPTLPKRRLIRETVADVAGGAHSLPELDYSRALRRIGLPQPTRRRKVRRKNGIWYLDNDFDEWEVTVEVNGAQHYELLASEADGVRRTVLQLHGRIVVDVSSYVVRHRIGLAMLATAEALVAHGYRPSTRTQRILDEYARTEGWAELIGLDLRRPA